MQCQSINDVTSCFTSLPSLSSCILGINTVISSQLFSCDIVELCHMDSCAIWIVVQCDVLLVCAPLSLLTLSLSVVCKSICCYFN